MWDLFFIFYEKVVSNSNNVTKKIYLKNIVKRNDENNENNENNENDVNNVNNVNFITNRNIKKHNKTIKK